MTTLITGASGFVGKHLTNALLDRGEDWLAASRSSGHDIRQKQSLFDLGDFSVAVHLAGETFVPDSFERSHDFFETNVLGTLNVLELCKSRQSRLVFVSSYVYGQPHYLPIDEKHPVSHWNPYASSKILGEELCRAYATNFELDIVVLRLFNVYGSGQADNFLIPRIISGVRKGHIQLHTGTPRRDFVHVDDVVNALVTAINADTQGLEVYNVGSGVSHSVTDVVEAATLNAPQTTVTFNGVDRPADVMNVVADCSKIASELDWKPTIGLAEGIQSLLTSS